MEPSHSNKVKWGKYLNDVALRSTSYWGFLACLFKITGLFDHKKEKHAYTDQRSQIIYCNLQKNLECNSKGQPNKLLLLLRKVLGLQYLNKGPQNIHSVYVSVVLPLPVIPKSTLVHTIVMSTTYKDTR